MSDLLDERQVAQPLAQRLHLERDPPRAAGQVGIEIHANRCGNDLPTPVAGELTRRPGLPKPHRSICVDLPERTLQRLYLAVQVSGDTGLNRIRQTPDRDLLLGTGSV